MRQLSIVIVFSVTTALYGQISYVVPERSKIEARLKLASAKNQERQETIEKLFKESGCDASEQRVKGTKLPNIICIVPGETDRQIIVGAHYDKVPAGRGVVDNWGGASLLPTLYEGLKEKPKHTLVFIAFSDEEDGMVGSRFYVKQLSKEQLTKITAMVNMDTLALGPTEVWLSHADRDLAQRLWIIAHATSLPVTAMNVDGVGSTDSESFRDKKVPAITIHSLTTKTLPVLHSAKDDFPAVQMDDYYQSCRLIAAYISYLDATLDSESQASHPTDKPLLH